MEKSSGESVKHNVMLEETIVEEGGMRTQHRRSKAPWRNSESTSRNENVEVIRYDSSVVGRPETTR